MWGLKKYNNTSESLFANLIVDFNAAQIQLNFFVLWAGCGQTLLSFSLHHQPHYKKTPALIWAVCSRLEFKGSAHYLFHLIILGD